MISHPINYFRDFRNDFFCLNTENQKVRPTIEKCRQIAIAALPLVSLYRPLHTPLSRVLDGVRLFSHFSELWKNFHLLEKDKLEIAYHLFQSCITITAIGLSILNPVYGTVSNIISDMIANTKECLSCLRRGDSKASLEAFARLILSSLLLTSICYGAIELTLATFMIQIVLGCYESIHHFKRDEILVGVLKTLTAGLHVYQAIPQAKLFYWKWDTQPVFEAILKQNERGFVYLDIPDEYVHQLHKILGASGSQLPPYFNPGQAGAHVSIILSNEMKQAGSIHISEIGKKFQFRIVQAESIQPLGFKGVSEVSFVTLSCAEMESLRAKYGFTPRLNGDHDFHMTFGITYEKK